MRLYHIGGDPCGRLHALPPRLRSARTRDVTLLTLTGQLTPHASEADERCESEVCRRSGVTPPQEGSPSPASMQPEDELYRAHRALDAISACHHAMVRAATEADLLRHICQAIVEVGGYRLAWVGQAEHDANRTVRPIAWAGVASGYVKEIGVSWSDTPAGQGPMGMAIRTGRPHATQHILTDPSFMPWRAAAVAHDFASALCLPLITDGVTIGGLGIYASEPHAFDDAENRLLVNMAGDLAYGIAALRARDERVRARVALRASERRFRALSEHATDLVFITGRDGLFRYVSPSFHAILGYDPATLIGTSCFDILHPDDVPFARDRWLQRLQGLVGVMRAETRVRHADGSWRWIEHSVRAAFDDPVIEGIITNARDVTERKTMEEALRYQALHDPLTGLPNRTLLRDRLDQALLTIARRPPDATSQANRGTVALLLLDLDRFKEVNDTFGHQYGDLLLRQVAERLRNLLPPSGVVARLGGDEFAILLPGSDENAAAVMAGTVRAALDTPFVVEGQALHIGVSVGIALNPACGTAADADMLLRQADIAMYTAKRDDRDYAVYAPALDAYTPQRLTLIADLQQAIVDDALFLHYQPKCDTVTGRVESVEALARWRLPHRGLIPPGEFIPLAETTGLIGPLTRWALGAALAQCRAWQRQGLCLPVAVNLSAATLRDVSLLDTVVQLLDANDVSPALLRIEVTESVLMADAERAREALSRLAALGVRISIDDYGTGYSSLSYLTRLPVDEIKIDRSFVQQMNVSPTDAAIVASTVALGHNLGLHVVAEGVEDSETWDRLAAMGCDTIQGYYLSRPLPVDALEAWLAARSSKE